MAVSSIKIALVICGLATCVTTDSQGRMRFDRMDLNKDEVLSTEEFYAFFDKMDTNSDQTLTVKEFTRIHNEKHISSVDKREFGVYDEQDGAIDGLAQRYAIPSLVRTLDTNSDGVVDLEEWNVLF